MSMKREEIIKEYENAVVANGLAAAAGNEEAAKSYELFKAGLYALRPFSREQVEKVWRGCKMCSGRNKIKLKPCANGDLGVQAEIGSAGKGDTFGLVVYNHLLASGYVDFPFCPFCGKPMTEEAVEMVMKRLEALNEKDRPVPV